MYQEIILDHYKNPHGRGLREPFDAESFQVNPTYIGRLSYGVDLDDGTTRIARVNRTLTVLP